MQNAVDNDCPIQGRGWGEHDPSDNLQLCPNADAAPSNAYEHGLTTAWRRDVGKEDVVPDASKASGSDAIPVDDIETAYRLLEKISKA